MSAALLAMIEEKEAEIARLREALAFYAKCETYQVNVGCDGAMPVMTDSGSRSRTALALWCEQCGKEDGGNSHCNWADCDDFNHDKPDGCHKFVPSPQEAAHPQQ